MARDLAEIVEAMNATPQEFAAAVLYHEQVVFGQDRQGYKQWWPGFVKQFEAILGELRRGKGKTKGELMSEGYRRIERQRSEETDKEWETARANRADSSTAKKYAAKIRELGRDDEDHAST